MSAKKPTIITPVEAGSAGGRYYAISTPARKHKLVTDVVREPGARLVRVDFSEVEKRLTPVRIVHFKDDGQDFLRWYVAANGVVVCSEPYQTWVWAGTVMLNVRVGRYPIVRSNEGHIRTVKHRVTKVEELTNGKA